MNLQFVSERSERSFAADAKNNVYIPADQDYINLYKIRLTLSGPGIINQFIGRMTYFSF